jgi:hypothetical protein
MDLIDDCCTQRRQSDAPHRLQAANEEARTRPVDPRSDEIIHSIEER